MDRKELERKVDEIIVDRFGVEAGVVNGTTEIEGDLGADSLDFAEVLMVLERDFNVSITDEEAGRVVTVGDIYDLIESKA